MRGYEVAVALEDKRDYVAYVDVNKKKIGLGTDMGDLTKEIETREGPRYYLNYMNAEDFYEGESDALITHECIHIIIYNMEGIVASKRLDFIDDNLQISRVE